MGRHGWTVNLLLLSPPVGFCSGNTGLCQLERFLPVTVDMTRNLTHPHTQTHTDSTHTSRHLLLLVQIMTFESSINRLNYFKIVILIYTDIVLITQTEIKALSGAVDVELNRAGSSWGPPGLSYHSQKRNDIPPLMNWQHAQT